MKKRTFIKLSAITAAGSLIMPISSCTSGGQSEGSTQANDEGQNTTTFELPDLGYGFDALEPHIDARTMEIHHDKHHAGYVRKLNAAIVDSPGYAGKTLDEIIKNVKPDDTAVRNNGGGHYNHSLFWETLSPKQTAPQGDLLSMINGTFGDFDGFKTAFTKASLGRFGSGWAWLSVDGDKLEIHSTANQDNPMMSQVFKKTKYPILGLDVWEHAYYLKYQNKRNEYVESFYNIINWDAVADRFTAYMKG